MCAGRGAGGGEDGDCVGPVEEDVDCDSEEGCAFSYSSN